MTTTLCQLSGCSSLLWFLLLLHCSMQPLALRSSLSLPSLARQTRWPHIQTTVSLPATTSDSVAIVKVLPEKEYLRRIADFLTRNLYAEDMPLGQRKILRDLEFQDLSKRYGQRVGKPKFPSTMVLAVEDQDIVGTSGVDCQILNTAGKRFREIKPGGPDSLFSVMQQDGEEEIVCVLANLAVRKNMRGRGIARKILADCEVSAREWGYSYLYLLVDSENKAAQRLYQKAGYSLYFVQEDATCVVSGPISLKTQDCINFCMRKKLSKSSGGGGAGGVAELLNNLFSAFNGKK